MQRSPAPRPGTAARRRSDGQTDVRPGTLVAAVVLGLVLVVLAAVVLKDGPRSTEADPAPASEPASPRTSGSFTAAPAIVEAADAPPLATPPPVEWALFHGVALPSSPTAGPSHVDGPVHAGYARTQQGALLAAVQIGTRRLLTRSGGWRRVLEEQVLPSPGREVFARLRGQVTDETDPPGTYGQVAGFRFVAYTGDVAVIQLVSRFARTGSLQMTTSTVRWVEGDWRLQLTADGGTSPTAQALPDLDGFVEWGP